ncbi:Phytanoyl-CoA dioxygenase [Balamuthia mandrillaris]
MSFLSAQHAAKVVQMNGFYHLEGAFDPRYIAHLHAEFMQHFEHHLRSRPKPNRGPHRYQLLLPLNELFTAERLLCNPAFFSVVRLLLGEDCILGLMSAHVALPGCEEQNAHIDYEPLFDTFLPLPPYCIYVHVPLVDITAENGPTEFWQGSPHLAISSTISSLSEFHTLPLSELPSTAVLAKAGDVIIKDMRCFHRGTANKSQQPRPMLSLVYCKKWYRIPYEKLYREEGYPVHRIPTSLQLSSQVRSLLRFCDHSSLSSLDNKEEQAQEQDKIEEGEAHAKLAEQQQQY